MAGITAEGLTIKDLDQILTDYRNVASQVFADLVSTGDEVDTSGNSALGRLIGVVAPSDEAIWEVIQMVYNSFNPSAATGVALDNLVSFSAISRYPARPTRAQVILEGNINTVINSPPAKMISSSTGRVFHLLQGVILSPKGCSGVGIFPQTVGNSLTYEIKMYVDDINTTSIKYTSPASGTVTSGSILAGLAADVAANHGNTLTTYEQNGILFIVPIDPFNTKTFEEVSNLSIQKVRKLGIAVDDVIGPVPQQALAIDTIVIPIAGWDSVINPVPAIPGRLRETDDELRERFRNSKFVQATNILESLIDGLMNVEGVEDVRIIENDTDNPDPVHGVPGHSFLPIVLGGIPTEVAQSIWLNKPFGIGSVGDTEVQVVDSLGYTHRVNYQRPVEVPIEIKISVTNTGSMPENIEDILRPRIVAYGTENYKIGDDVIYSRFYAPIMEIPGFQVNSLTIAKKGQTQGMANIEIGFKEVATFAAADITVTTV
ncbi:baseplate component [Pseudomonas phage PaSzW-1]|uniref:Baseplate component n=2 Tax=Pakpunavirus TaxID=1921407 RepID=A0A411BE62_9CAUD|nr:baseplate wedge subunit [Pseudomonas phage PaoP5]YP_010762019.1 putative baseplate component [Pseudomonas phage PaGz-1]YP_010762746.1 putative baseplate component [Pseudomonas phage PaZq-1]QAY01708.1 baseplate component [Pseudomonas phage PaSzW-1]ALT58354.1 putative baseplate component [Pseudomonas phage PaoP5]QAX98135.1 putative baseplate component [Pseudomonas phage PaGz-1]QAX99815.1 putative baseplate component [Pseudomonas phage PaZq-1]